MNKYLTANIIFVCILMLVFQIVGTQFDGLKATSSAYSSYTVVIDPGHGARDGGCVGQNGTVEKELNLDYAKTLKKLLESRGVKVVMTRESDKAIYDEDASSKKTSEMKAREKTIMDNSPDLVISIHMNSFALKSVKGVKVFYKQSSEPSKSVANYIHRSVNSYLGKNFSSPTVGDYYILNCSPYTSVLIECGYLSNLEEEELLKSKEYREKLMHSVFCGILIFLGINSY